MNRLNYSQTVSHSMGRLHKGEYCRHNRAHNRQGRLYPSERKYQSVDGS